MGGEETRENAERRKLLDRIRELEEKLAECRKSHCRGDDPTCPCHDGDLCHYRGENPMMTPLEVRCKELKDQCDTLTDELAQYGKS